ncbi:hypothetical protein PIB30_063285 [Stylosanthes scabra]|uniref:Uncharacterized protein n=1 Tax=Stylosanthes scabra TaxID=79078 RepID=A0ABU6XJW3_9FABA|nr:hypothetical protein [Stylosanthes scabra]
MLRPPTYPFQIPTLMELPFQPLPHKPISLFPTKTHFQLLFSLFLLPPIPQNLPFSPIAPIFRAPISLFRQINGRRLRAQCGAVTGGFVELIIRSSTMSNEAHGISGAGHKETVFVGSSERIPSDIDEDNVCILTGEEFSADFLRDRIGFRRFPVITDADQRLPNRTDFNSNNNYQIVYEDLNHGYGIVRSDSDCNSDLSDHSVPRGYVAEVDNRNYPNNFSRVHFDPGYCRQVSGQLSRQGSGHFSRQASGHFTRQVSGKFTRQLSGKILDGVCCDRVASVANASHIYVVDSPQSSHAYGKAYSEVSVEEFFPGQMTGSSDMWVVRHGLYPSGRTSPGRNL